MYPEISPEFKAIMISLYESGTWMRELGDSVATTHKFIDKLKQKGYCIVKYTGN